MGYFEGFSWDYKPYYSGLMGLSWDYHEIIMVNILNNPFPVVNTHGDCSDLHESLGPVMG